VFRSHSGNFFDIDVRSLNGPKIFLRDILEFIKEEVTSPVPEAINELWRLEGPYPFEWIHAVEVAMLKHEWRG
jgi:hypothetical protein